MRKVYYTKCNVIPSFSLEETIEYDFDHFSLERYKIIYCNDIFVDNLQTAKEYQDDNISNMIILEYSLDENDLFRLFLDKKIISKPTNSWYYWWDESQQKIKEIPKIFV